MSAHALLIGVTRFSDPELSGLRAPRSDVEALKAVLEDPARGGFDEVIPCIDEDLLVIRDRLSSLLEDRRPDDMVLLYYSGHGIVDRGNNLFLATGETRAEKPRARSLPSSEVREMMEQSRAGRLVVVLDCCHSGVFTEGAKGMAAPVNERTFDAGEGAAGQYVITATNSLQYALDSRTSLGSDGAVQSDLSHFTSWLVSGLGRGEAAPDKPEITIDDLYTYLYRRAKESGAAMTPQRYVKHNSGEMVIARNPAAQEPHLPDELLVRLDSGDWKTRLDSITELRDMVARREKLRSTVRKLLRDRISNERDRDVHDAMLAWLVELDHKHDRDRNPPKDGGPTRMSALSDNFLSGEEARAYAGRRDVDYEGALEERIIAKHRARINANLTWWLCFAGGLLIFGGAVGVTFGWLNPLVNLWITVLAIAGVAFALIGLRRDEVRVKQRVSSELPMAKLAALDYIRVREMAYKILLVACIMAAALASFGNLLFAKLETVIKQSTSMRDTGPSVTSAPPLPSGNVQVHQSGPGSTPTVRTPVIDVKVTTCQITGEGQYLIESSGVASGPLDGTYLFYAEAKAENGGSSFRPVCSKWSSPAADADPPGSPDSCIRNPGEPTTTSWTISGTHEGLRPSELHVGMKRPHDGGILVESYVNLECHERR